MTGRDGARLVWISPAAPSIAASTHGEIRMSFFQVNSLKAGASVHRARFICAARADPAAPPASVDVYSIGYDS
jgi:hypothetical protein